MKIGKAKFGGFTQKKYFKLKDGESTFRILPPLGDLADEGRWSVFYKIHYGYKNTKGKLRIFQSSLVVNRKTKMVDVPDAADQRIKDLKAKLEQAKAAGNKAVVEKLTPLVSGQKPQYNLDSNHYMNVVDLQGNIGVLKLRHRAKVALDNQIKRLREKGTDPLAPDTGRFFTFTRTGMGLDTSFSVEVQQEKLTVAGVGEVSRDVVHKLSDELISRLGDEAAQLDKLYKLLTAEEVKRIVDSSDLMTGQSPVIDELFDQKGATAAMDQEGEDEEDYQEPAPMATPTPVAAQPTSQPAVAAFVETKAEARAAPAAIVTSKPLTTTAEKLADVEDADFLKSLGL